MGPFMHRSIIDESPRARQGTNELYKGLRKQIAEFEKELTEDEEVGACLTSFGRELSIRIENVGFRKPFFIVFNGRTTATDQRVKLIQHASQINVLLTAVRKPDNQLLARRFFSADSDDSQA